MLENCSGEGKIARVETRAAWAMENKLFVMTFKCLQFISSDGSLLLLAVNMGTLTGDEFPSSIILWFKFEAEFELIIYAVGENLIERGFGFCLHGAWESDKCLNLLRCYDWQFVMHMWKFKCSSKGNMSSAVVGDDDDNHKQTATSRHFRTRITFINHEHLLNRSPLLFCASGSSTPFACKVSQWQLCNELWTLKTENERERERRNRRNSAARCFQSNRLARLLFFCFLEFLLRLSGEFKDFPSLDWRINSSLHAHAYTPSVGGSHKLF